MVVVINETNERPWGEWKVVHTSYQRAVKMLTVNPGCMLSLQTHQERSEFWVPLETGLVAYTRNKDGDFEQAQLLMRCRAFEVRRGVAHRLMNPTKFPLTLVEIIVGNYDEDDIERIHDAYGRE